jgi:hypothetical protein
MVVLIMYGGLTNEDIIEWQMCLRVDGISTF